MLDIRMAVEVLSALVSYRDQLIKAIYEITGLSDIVRGSSKATETATAQNLKARYGSLRARRAAPPGPRAIFRSTHPAVQRHHLGAVLQSIQIVRPRLHHATALG